MGYLVALQHGQPGDADSHCRDFLRILHGWKSFISHSVKRFLPRGGGRFWQTESYDHWIRDDAERARLAAYVENNPVKAGFCRSPEDWEWSSAYERRN